MAPGWNRRTACLATVVVWLGSMSTTGGQTQEQRPQDSTVIENEPQRAPQDQDVEQDDATRRLEWQRRAWGVVTPAFRANAIQQGKDHSDKKNSRGPKWVNIGPTRSDFEQNGSHGNGRGPGPETDLASEPEGDVERVDGEADGGDNP